MSAKVIVKAVFLISLILLPRLTLSQEYLFPDWIIDEMLDQGIPMYTFELGIWECDINGHNFRWEISLNPDVTKFSVSGFDIDFVGSNYEYQLYVLSIEWLSLFGVLPGGGITASSTNLGECMEDMSNIALQPLRSDVSVGKRAQLISGGIQYENAKYHSDKITGFTIPIYYSKMIDPFKEIGIFGSIRYAYFGGSKKYHFKISPYYKTAVTPRTDLGCIINLNMIFTSTPIVDVPTIAILGAGGYAAYNYQFDKLSTRVALLIESKFGEDEFNLPVVWGMKGSYPITKLIDLHAELIGGFDPVSANEKDYFQMYDFKIKITDFYSVGFQKAINLKSYKNNIVYVTFMRFF